MIVVGCDPGVSGAVSVISHDGFLDLFDLPTVSMESNGRTKRKLDARALAVVLRDTLRRHDAASHDVEVWLEDVHAMPGSASGSGANTSLMHSKGVIEGVVGALGYRLNLVGSRKWKSAFGASADKDHAIKLAQDLYPDAPVTLKKHHNRAESLLIARYGMRERF